MACLHVLLRPVDGVGVVGPWLGVMMIVGMPCVLLPPLDVQNEEGWTAAIWAASHGHVDCLTALIENKVDLDIKVREVMTSGLWHF